MASTCPVHLPQVLMYCTAGVRCERASAFMRKRGIQNVFQLEGGIHRYLDAYPEDGGFWVRHGTNSKGMRTERQWICTTLRSKPCGACFILVSIQNLTPSTVPVPVAGGQELRV